MARRRLGVALLLDPPLADEVDGLRRALGAGALARISPHVTLVPPVNVAEDDLPATLARIRDGAAAAGGPLRLTLGPPGSFLPRNNVLYLAVGGDLDALARVRAAVFADPLARREEHPFVPHMTVAEGADPDRITAALGVLADYRADFEADRVVLLEAVRGPAGRRWLPLGDAVMEPRHIVGRGGLPLELTLGRHLDPEAAALLRSLPAADAAEFNARRAVTYGGAARIEVRQGRVPPARVPSAGVPPAGEEAGAEIGVRHGPWPLVVVARRAEGVVGVGAAWWSAERPHRAVAVAADVRGQGIGSHIRARLTAALAEAAVLAEPDVLAEAGEVQAPGERESKTDE